MPPTTSSPRPDLDVSGRALVLRPVDLDRFFHPRVVAVVGASDAARRPNAALTQRIKEWTDEHGARFVPVTPMYGQVQGVATVGRIADVDAAIDLAVLLTGTERVVDHFAEAVAAGAAFAVVFSAGFAEVGPSGARLERRLAALAAAGRTRLLGPNTNLNAFERFRDDLDGPALALITQSGHQGRPLFQGQELGIRVSHWAPTGNEVDLEFADFACYFADQPEVGVVAAYVEGFKDGRALMLAADHAVRRRTPLVVVKVGRTDEGASMARSHTGHVTGADAVVDAALRQSGVIRVDGLDELLDVSAMFARTQRPRGDGVCVYAVSGGTGAHMADMLSAAGLRLPRLTRRTQAALHDGLIPAYLRVSNPVDCGGPPVRTPAGRRILELLVADPNVAVLVVPITGAVETMSGPLTRDLVDVAATTDTPIFVVWGSPVGTEAPYRETLLGSRLPVFRTFANCVTAVRAYFDWWTFADRHRAPFADAPREAAPGAARARRALDGAGPGDALDEVRSKAVLRAYGIRTPREELVRSAAGAVRTARRLGLPVVMKLISPALPHKSEHGLVAVGVPTLAKVAATYEELQRRARRVDRRAPVEGVLVSELVAGGAETLVGVSRDPLFGPVVTVGFGGVLVEVVPDVAVGVPPFDREHATRMVRGLRAGALLDGVRGGPALDRGALVDAVMQVQRLALDLADEVEELDVNPLLVRRRGVVALDALVVRR